MASDRAKFSQNVIAFHLFFVIIIIIILIIITKDTYLYNSSRVFRCINLYCMFLNVLYYISRIDWITFTLMIRIIKQNNTQRQRNNGILGNRPKSLHCFLFEYLYIYMYIYIVTNLNFMIRHFEFVAFPYLRPPTISINVCRRYFFNAYKIYLETVSNNHFYYRQKGAISMKALYNKSFQRNNL